MGEMNLFVRWRIYAVYRRGNMPCIGVEIATWAIAAGGRRGPEGDGREREREEKKGLMGFSFDGGTTLATYEIGKLYWKTLLGIASRARGMCFTIWVLRDNQWLIKPFGQRCCTCELDDEKWFGLKPFVVYGEPLFQRLVERRMVRIVLYILVTKKYQQTPNSAALADCQHVVRRIEDFHNQFICAVPILFPHTTWRLSIYGIHTGYGISLPPS